MTPDSALTAYPKGDKTHVHVSLYQRHVTTLDQAAARYECSRAEFIEALITDYSKGLMPGVDALLSSRKEPNE
jgi:hypothetical protein